MLKRFITILAAFALVALTLGAVKVAQIKEISSQPHTMPPSAVTSVEATQEAWKPIITAIGSLAPVEGTTISNEIEGTVTKIAVENGAAVKAGDLLLELDTSVEAAQLQAAEARLELAQIQQKRTADLLAKQTVSQAELDQTVAGLHQAEAEVAGLKATIAKKNIRAPFDGRVGIRLVNVGQFIPKGQALLPLQKLNPIYVNFTIPQRQIMQLVVGDTVQVTVDAFDKKFPGKVTAINPEVDEATRNVSMQALLENPDETLRAGMFAHVDVELPEGQPLVVVPATAISYAPYGNSVFVLEKMKGQDGKEYLGARQQFVKIGPARGDQVAILEGLKPGEKVASSGVFKLRNGAPIQVNNAVQPTNNPAPTPANT